MKKIGDVLNYIGELQGVYAETPETVMRIEWCDCGCDRSTVNFAKGQNLTRTSLSDEEIVLLIALLQEFQRGKEQYWHPEQVTNQPSPNPAGLWTETEGMAAFNARVEAEVQGRKAAGQKCLSVELDYLSSEEYQVVLGVFRRVAAIVGLDFNAASDHYWVIQCWMEVEKETN